MRNASKLFKGMTLLPVVLLFNACGVVADGTEVLEAGLEAGREIAEPRAISANLVRDAVLRPHSARESIPFTEFDDAIGDQGTRPTRQLFTSAEEYRRYFGHDAPGVDFSKEWVLFFSPGAQRTGGHDASITSIRVAERLNTLYVTTKLESPGPNCFVTQALTQPYTLVKFQRPYGREWVAKYRDLSEVRSCPTDLNPCAAMMCEVGTTCEVMSGEARCILMPKSSGCAAVRCAAGTHCDDSGARARCVPNTNPCAAMLCATGTTCVVGEDGTAKCEGSRSAGCAATTCLEGTTCVEDEAGNAECKKPCASDTECEAVADYCSGCDCRALASGEQLPVCDGPGVRCFADACKGRKAVCENRVCTIASERIR